jgi:hypothetical protein
MSFANHSAPQTNLEGSQDCSGSLCLSQFFLDRQYLRRTFFPTGKNTTTGAPVSSIEPTSVILDVGH